MVQDAPPNSIHIGTHFDSDIDIGKRHNWELFRAHPYKTQPFYIKLMLSKDAPCIRQAAHC